MRGLFIFLIGLGLGLQAMAEPVRPVPRSSTFGKPLPEGTVVPVVVSEPGTVRPRARQAKIPRTRWEHVKGSDLWTRAAISALKDHGKPLISMVPRDIKTWCPAYAAANPDQRAAFWVGFLSALAKHESTYRPSAVGGGGKWHGLLQILPGTARGYGCRARSGAALRNGPANLSCAIRIMAVTIPRDGEVGASGRGGAAADWGPMVFRKKRADIAAYTRRQAYCRPLVDLRPKARPKDLVLAQNKG